MDQILEAYPRLPEVVIYDWVAVSGWNNSFVRLADVRLRCLWMDQDRRLKEACAVGILTSDGSRPTIRWVTSNKAYLHTGATKKGKIQIIHRGPPETDDMKKCRYAFAPLYARIDNALEQRIIDTSWASLPVLEPRWYRLVRNRNMAEPLPNSMYADHTLQVCPEDSVEQYHLTNNVYDKAFADLTPKELAILKERAHAEYLEDLHGAWQEADISTVGTECAHGELLHFDLCQSGGMVVAVTRQFMTMAGHPNAMKRSDFATLCQERNWHIAAELSQTEQSKEADGNR